GTLEVVYAGNLGRFQNLNLLIDAADILRDEKEIAFHFFGDGAMREQLSRRVSADRLERVHMHGYATAEGVRAFLRETADLGVVCLSRGMLRASYPSKTMSYLRQGCPVLVLAEGDSDLVRTITRAGAGLQSTAATGEELAETLRQL